MMVMATKMEEEDEEESMMLKRNTDCVYFLASPFTCKKGMECEYRHNEMARLNHRECWYWSCGSCLNPACGFRHPPLDVNNEASVGATSYSHFTSVPSSQHNVPCYFYFSGYCNKGDRCPFLHAPSDSSSVKEKLEQEATNAPTSDPMTTVKTEPSLPLPVKDALTVETERSLPVQEKDASTSEMSYKIDNELVVAPNDHPPQSATNDSLKTSASRQVTDPEYEEVDVTGLGSLSPSEDLDKFLPRFSSDESSEYHVGNQIEREEWLESSPGFDVLVDGRPENVDYGVQEMYFQDLDMYPEGLECYDIEYGYVDQMDYDRRTLLEDIRCESAAYSDDELQLDVAEVPSPYSMSQRVDQLMPYKRNFLPVEFPAARQHTVDLRDHLRKRRIHDHRTELYASTRHNMSHLRVRRHETLQNYGSCQRLQGRLASRVEKNGFFALPAKRSGFRVSSNSHGWSTYPWLDRYKRSYPWLDRYKRSYEIRSKHSAYKFPRRSFPKQRNRSEASSFTGPKILAQVQEEASEGSGDGYTFMKTRRSSRNKGKDFEGPKSLSELRENKRAITDGTVDVKN